MNNWADRAKTRFLKKAQEGTDKTDKTPFSSVSSVGTWAFCEKQGVVSSVSSVGFGGNPEKRMFSDAPANDAQTGAEIDPGRHCYPHTDACNSVELALMATRLATFARIGMDVDHAEKLAEKLLARDRESDDRYACVECSSLTGCTGNWRCMAFRQRGARDPGLPHDLTTMLQRCPTYTSGQPVIDVYASVKALPPKPPLRPQQQYHPLTPDQQQAARDYHTHHFGCAKCRVAGQGRGERCQQGAELWDAYAGDGDGR